MTGCVVSKNDLSHGFKVHRFDPIAEVNRVATVWYVSMRLGLKIDK
jgi:hypothetical protein